MEKVILNGVLVDKFTSFHKVLLDMQETDLQIVKFDTNKFIIPTIDLFFQLNCKKRVTLRKMNQALTMVELKGIDLSDYPLALSNSNKYKLLLALALINNSKNYVIVYPDIYFDDYNMNIMLRILKKISREFKKNIYIISNDFDLLYRECDYLIIYSKNNIIYNKNRKELYKEKDKLLNNNYELPKILQFVYLVESKQKIKLEPTFDIKELMKDIYRNV